MLDFHVSWRGNSIDAYLFIRRLVRRYGGVPIYTDGAGWCADAFRWAGAERVVQCAKEETEAFDDPFPARKSGPCCPLNIKINDIFMIETGACLLHLLTERDSQIPLTHYTRMIASDRTHVLEISIRHNCGRRPPPAWARG
jgi:hypothetical protein